MHSIRRCGTHAETMRKSMRPHSQQEARFVRETCGTCGTRMRTADAHTYIQTYITQYEVRTPTSETHMSHRETSSLLTVQGHLRKASHSTKRASASHPCASLRRMAAGHSTRDMHVRLQYADVTITLVAEQVSYSPDALSDMANRAVNMLAESLLIIGPYERAALTLDDDDEDDTGDE